MYKIRTYMVRRYGFRLFRIVFEYNDLYMIWENLPALMQTMKHGPFFTSALENMSLGICG